MFSHGACYPIFTVSVFFVDSTSVNICVTLLLSRLHNCALVYLIFRERAGKYLMKTSFEKKIFFIRYS